MNSPRFIGQRLFLCFSITYCSLVSATTMAGTIRHDVPDSDYVNLAAEPVFAAVGKLTRIEAGSTITSSGTLIDPQWVLVAGHSIGGDDLFGGGITSIGFEVGGHSYAADTWIPHPSWASNGGSFFAGTDIGLVHLTSPVADVVPVGLYNGDDEFEATATIVGFGFTGTGLTGSSDSSTTKRAGQNVIDLIFGPAIDNRLLGIDFDNPLDASDNAYGSPTPLALEYLPAFADSGGGVFIDVDGKPRLAGVVSFTSSEDLNTNSDYGDRAGLTRVSKYLTWIDSELPVIDGDFDLDRVLTTSDIDLLNQSIVSGGNEMRFDINGDQSVDLTDQSEWLGRAAMTNGFSQRYLVGDTNLDGMVDATDLNAVGIHWLKNVSTWSEGDLNADGLVNASDLNLLGINWRKSSLAAARAVPEPSAIWFIPWALLGFMHIRRKR